MKTSSDVSYSLLIFAFLLCFFLVFLLFFLLFRIWILPFVPLTLPNIKNSFKINTFWDLLKFLLILCSDFDQSSWLAQCGYDAFTYLLYQRRVIGLLSIFGLYFLFDYLFILIMTKKKLESDLDTDKYLLIDLFLQNYEENRYFIILFVISSLSIYKMVSLKLHIQKMFFKTYYNNGQDNGLRLRTVHCQGSDAKGTLLLQSIGEYIGKKGPKGKILQYLLIPDYSNLLFLEKKRLFLKDLRLISQIDDSILTKRCCSCCIKLDEKYDRDYYEQKNIETLEEIQLETENPVISSGHCFICFNDIKTMEQCLQQFDEKSIRNMFLRFWLDLKGLFCCFRQRKIRTARELLGLARKVSTFNNNTENINIEELENIKKKKKVLPVITMAPSPYDINWINIRSGRVSFMFCRRGLLNFAIFSLMLFLTTPAAILQSAQNLKWVEFTWTESIPHPFGEIVKISIPPLFVLLVNQVILLLIDYSAELEGHFSFSGYQISILEKGVFYMMLSVLIIPAFAIETSHSLYMMIAYDNDFDIKLLWHKSYLSASGQFFLLLLLEQGVIAVFCYLLRLKELFFSFGNVIYAHYKRLLMNDGESWRKDLDDQFQYGYFSAQMIVCLSIIFLFLIQFTWILPAGIVYFVLRYLLDSYNLYIVFKREINSHGKLIQIILKYSIFPIFLLQITHLSFFYGYNIIQFGFTVFISLCTTFIMLVNDKHLLSTENFKDGEENIDFSGKIKEWKALYQHPLVINHFHASTYSDLEESCLRKSNISIFREKRSREGLQLDIRKNIIDLEKILEY